MATVSLNAEICQALLSLKLTIKIIITTVSAVESITTVIAM